jgi:hypothetical protein
MSISDDRARFIREEFACFVRIGANADLREQVAVAWLGSDAAGGGEAGEAAAGAGEAAVIRLEEHDAGGTLREVWIMEANAAQLARLRRFLDRFTVEEVRQFEALLDR